MKTLLMLKILVGVLALIILGLLWMLVFYNPHAPRGLAVPAQSSLP